MEAVASSMQWSKQYEGTNFDGVLPRLIEPEILLPSQFFKGARSNAVLEGERRLMLAVMEDAVSCFQKYAGAKRPRSQRLFRKQRTGSSRKTPAGRSPSSRYAASSASILSTSAAA